MRNVSDASPNMDFPLKIGRGMHKREPITCDVCGKVVHGKNAYTNHRRVHLGNKVTSGSDVKAIASTLKSLASWLSSGRIDDTVTMSSLAAELDKETARVDLSLRMLSLQRVVRLCRLTEQLEKIDQAISSKISNNSFDGVPLADLMVLMKQVQESINNDFNLLQEIKNASGGTGERELEEIFMLLTHRTTARANRAASVISVQNPDGTTEIKLPDDPRVREELRKDAALLLSA